MNRVLTTMAARRVAAATLVIGLAGAGLTGTAFATTGPTIAAPSRTAVVGDHHVSLTATEYAILAVLLDNPGRVMARRHLLAATGRQSAGDRAADVYIAQLRAKLGPAWPIRTVRGTGYVLGR